ncbi:MULTISPECIES: DUF6879 family protein [Streptacidiphilus]|uniref:DUF6879 family protein n=1 Tax=Streptacidiphilus cavernicola TaxID=3342716 RepID=A0ABV6UXE7_9ACTN|nr:DUF6879 family protein [Streptacidiphilus jeojiense]
MSGAQVSAVHLEMRDTYGVADEAEEFAQWKVDGLVDADPDSESWMPWTSIIRDAVARGVSVRRARIVSEPVTQYTHWLYASTPANLAAGELVRWLPRAKASDLSLPGNDFWVLDDHTVLFNHFTGDGDWADPATELRHDAAAVKLCSAAFEGVWDRAVEHENYTIR